MRRAALWLLLCVGLGVGAPVLAFALSGLREAHLYRQRSNEGLKFAWVALGVMAACVLLGVATIAAWRLRSLGSSVTSRRVFAAISVLLVVVMVAGVGAFVWVESHGDRCIGSCG